VSDRKSLFRPCIDLHEGRVKQIVGGSLSDDGADENFVSDLPSTHFASMFAKDNLTDGHVIMLGPGNTQAARLALAAWPGGLQVGGGINIDNAPEWIDAGASHVIVTSWLFDDNGSFREDRAEALAEKVTPQRLVIDLSCRRCNNGWTVAMNRWQTLTDLAVTPATLDRLAKYCDQFLVHAADVEGKCDGIDEELVELLGCWRGRQMTYAGGVGSMADLERVQASSAGHVDVTVGSALDIFGGTIATDIRKGIVGQVQNGFYFPEVISCCLGTVLTTSRRCKIATLKGQQQLGFGTLNHLQSK
jgi:phosphoribosylformimino-5-aminoimidazole carboxamide ribotide isomerase